MDNDPEDDCPPPMRTQEDVEASLDRAWADAAAGRTVPVSEVLAMLDGLLHEAEEVRQRRIETAVKA